MILSAKFARTETTVGPVVRNDLAYRSYRFDRHSPAAFSASAHAAPATGYPHHSPTFSSSSRPHYVRIIEPGQSDFVPATRLERGEYETL